MTPSLNPLLSRRDLIAAAGAVSLAPSFAASQETESVAAALASPAADWTALFDRTSGWTGADGIYSFPLNNDERPGQANRTFFTFSDTFIGEVNAGGKRLSGSSLVNNTQALLRGTAPDPSKIEFFYKTGSAGAPKPQVVPDTPDRWFWPNDGIVQGGQIRMFSLRMKSAPNPDFPFAVDGISLLSSDAAANPPFQTYTQVDAPLYAPAAGTRGELTFGLATMLNTEQAGAPNPDGFLYVYGLQNDRSKKLLAARVLPGKIEDFSAYRFWNGSAWVPNLTDAAALTPRVSSEFSITPLPDGRFILVCQLDTISDKTAVRYGTSPIGPWSDPTIIYRAPEVTLTPNTYCYNAKAHPHLSEPGRLLISYNVNTFSFAEHFQNADIYRPRFIWFPLG